MVESGTAYREGFDRDTVVVAFYLRGVVVVEVVGDKGVK